MRFFIKIGVLETIHGEYDVVARKAIGEQLQKLAASGKMENGGAFGDSRGGYMVLNVDSPAELRELLGLPLLVNAHIESHPLTTFEELAAFFKKHAATTDT